MGVRATLAGLTFNANDSAAAAAKGVDLPGLNLLCQLKCQEISQILSWLAANVVTSGNDSANNATLTAQVTALS